MSLVAGNNSKGEKSKKFQSLNINNIYQGASSKPQAKTAPQKHGLQSLGKVPTARRAPANLPSLKAENFGNDTSVNLVPASGAGWGSQPQSGQPTQSTQQQQQQQQPGKKVVDGNSSQENSTPEYLNNTSSGDNSGSKSWGNSNTNYISQRSAALFGQDFPTLESTANDQQDKKGQQQQPSQPPPSQPTAEPGKSGDKYGPGPALRPQSFAQWTFSGKPPGGNVNNNNSNNNHTNNNNNEAPVDNSVENNRSSLASAHPVQRSQASVANTLKFDVSSNSPLQYFGGPVVSRKQPQSATPPGEGRNKVGPAIKPGGRPTRDGPLFQASIIDRDKLKRMDDIELTDDDWTRSDETFDYNKKIDSAEEEEEDEDLNRGSRVRSNWADQLTTPQKENRFDCPPPQANNSLVNSGGTGVRKLICEPPPFFDDEEYRRAKKNEEVLQNIERARRRREEEEQKYNKTVEYSPPREVTLSDNYHLNKRQGDNNGGPRRSYRQQSCSSNSSREDNVVHKHSSAQYGNNKYQEPTGQEYDDRKHDQGSGNYGPRKQVVSSSSVPPRFKRHGGELQQFKRGYQGKGPHEDDYRGQPQQQQQQQQHHWERHSSESDPERIRDTPQAELQPDQVAEEESPEAVGQQAQSKFVAISTSNSKDNFETNSTYSSSSMERYQSSVQAQANPGAAPLDRHNSYEDRRSVENDQVKGHEKSNNVEQPNYIKRSGQQDHSGRRQDLDRSNQQQHNYNSRQHKDDYDYNSMKRNGRDKKVDDHYDNYRDSRGSRGGRGGPMSQRGGRYDGGRGGQRGGPQGPKKIILPSRGGRDGPQAHVRPEKRVTDEEEVEDLPNLETAPPPPKQQPAQQQQPQQQQQHSSNDNYYEAHENSPIEIEKPLQIAQVEAPKTQEKIENVISAPLVSQEQPIAQEAQRDPGTTGWFAPRGQPSRRGRGGVPTQGVSRTFSKNENDYANSFDDNKVDDWDSSSESYDENRRRQRKDFEPQSRRGGLRKKEHEEYEDYGRNPRGMQPSGQGVKVNQDGKEVKRGNLPPHIQQQQQQLVAQQQQQVKQIAYERRQNKLPPRLAKQKEQNRMKYTGREGWGNETMQGPNSGYQWDQMSGDQSGGSMDFNSGEQRQGFQRGDPVRGQMLGMSQVEGLSHPDHQMTESRSGTVQTIIFENTNFKGGAGKMFKSIDGQMKDQTLHMPLGFGGPKPEDSSDLKLDFTFEPTDMPPHLVAEDKSMSRQSQGPIVGHPASADDLNLRIAGVKKVWETGDSSMSPGPDGIMVNQPTFGSQSFVTDDKGFGVPNNDVMGDDPNHVSVQYDKCDLTIANVAKVRPQMMQQPQQQQQHQQPPMQHSHHHQQQQQQLDVGRSMGSVAAANNVAFSRLMNSGGMPSLQSPPSIMSQPPSMYQAFQLDPNRGNQLYSTYPSVMLSSPGLSGNADIFGPPPNASNQFRMQSSGSGQYGNQQSTANNVLLSQSLMSSAMEQSNQIGPIGTKGGNAANAFQQNPLGPLAGSATSPLMIPFDTSNPMNFLANTLQRTQAGQTAFYQALAAGSRQPTAAYGMQGFPNNPSIQQQINAQLRNQGLSYMKTDTSVAAAMKVPRNDNLVAMGANMGLQPHLQMNNQAPNQKGGQPMGNLGMRSHVNSGLVPNHGGNVGMPPPAPGPTYSPTPIQRPQGKPPMENEDPNDVVAMNESKLAEE